MIDQTSIIVVGPPYTRGLGQTAPFPPPPLIGGPEHVHEEIGAFDGTGIRGELNFVNEFLEMVLQLLEELIIYL